MINVFHPAKNYYFRKINFFNMHAYRFRIISDDNEEFLRVVDVLANQTFEAFHQFLTQTCKLKGMELASFYLCDNEWHKKREVTLMDMAMEEGQEEEQDSGKKKVLIMKDVEMRLIINDPHQKILYVFDFIKMITLSIELMKIVDAETTEIYPKIIDSKSELQLNPLTDDVFLEELLTDEEELKNLNSDSIEPDTEDMN